MIDQKLVELARDIAAKHGLDSALVCAVIEQESEWDPWEVRFEPGFLGKYIAPMEEAHKVSATEAYCRAFSWGYMQVMGEDAREFGFKGKSLAELCDPATGIEFGCRILANRMKRANGDVHNALLAYNGGANLSYPSEVLARVGNYRPPSAMSA